MSSNSSQPVVPVANNAPKRERKGKTCVNCGKMLYSNHRCSNINIAASSSASSSSSSSSGIPAHPASAPISAASAPQNARMIDQNVAREQVEESKVQDLRVVVEDDDSDHEPEEEAQLQNDENDEEVEQQGNNELKIILTQKGRSGKQIEWTMKPTDQAVIHDVRLENGGGNIHAKINFAQATRDFHGIPSAPPGKKSRPDNLFLSYLLTAYPCDTVKQVCDATNQQLKTKNINTVKLTPHLWFKFLGIILAMTLQELPNRKSYWDDHKANQETKRIFSGPNFGRFMLKSHFDMIMANFCLIEPMESSQDSWRAARPIVDGFNMRRKIVITPGQFITIDESMCPWQGQGEWNPINGCPRIIKIPRKPTPVGVEIKNLIDCETKTLLFLELQEGTQQMQSKLYGDGREVQKSTGLVLRLTKGANVWGSNRVIIGDSAFASVMTCYNLLTKAQLYCMGIVKTATSLAPAKAVSDHLHTKGDQVTFVGELEGVKLIAHGHMDKTKKLIVASCGRTIAGVPQKKPRSRYNEETKKMEKYFTLVHRTELMAQYFKGSGDIDWHNRLRAFLSLEKVWITWSWWKRVFGTVFAMIVTDAYLMYVFDQKDQPNHKLLSRQEFMERLSFEMIHNEIKNTSEGDFRQKRKLRSENALQDLDEDAVDESTSLSDASCTYLPLWMLRAGQKKVNKRYGRLCTECHRKAYSYCVTCSHQRGETVTVCSERVCGSTEKSCKQIHESNRNTKQPEI
jgi:hypothetical protein